MDGLPKPNSHATRLIVAIEIAISEITCNCRGIVRNIHARRLIIYVSDLVQAVAMSRSFLMRGRARSSWHRQERPPPDCATPRTFVETLEIIVKTRAMPLRRHRVNRF